MLARILICCLVVPLVSFLSLEVYHMSKRCQLKSEHCFKVCLSSDGFFGAIFIGDIVSTAALVFAVLVVFVVSDQHTSSTSRPGDAA